jgi:general secretion pathway protein G
MGKHPACAPDLHPYLRSSIRLAQTKQLKVMQRSKGFTLLDLLMAVTIMSLLSAIIVPSYSAFADNSKESQAATDILRIQLALDQIEAKSFAFPDSLDELANVPRVDPWGAQYRYLRIAGNTTPGLKGKQRKDKNLNPLNSDYDLYSVGKDLDTKLPLTAKAAGDDVIRAGNGGFIGLAMDH